MVAATVPDGSITSDKLGSGAVGRAQLQPGAVGPSQLAAGAVGPGQLAPGAVLASLLASSQGLVPNGGIILSLDATSASSTAGGYVNIGTIPLLAERWETRWIQPSPRQKHTALWTGSQMLIWGGGDAGVFLNTGGRYNPATDGWQPITTGSAPSGRWGHRVVWTGTEMLVWGGRADGNVDLADGARYNPATDTWTPLPNNNAPSARHQTADVWTGTEMLIWEGGAMKQHRD